jgi:hypothetical protein
MTKLVGFALVEWMDADGYCCPGRESIAERCGITDRTVDKAVRRLEAAGLLRVKRGKGRRHVNEYQAVLKGERRSRFPREKANEPPVKGEPRSQELVQLVSGRRSDGGAPLYLDKCVTCGARFASPDDAELYCEGCRPRMADAALPQENTDDRQSATTSATDAIGEVAARLERGGR